MVHYRTDLSSTGDYRSNVADFLAAYKNSGKAAQNQEDFFSPRTL
jgi:hypothetical protein